MRTKHRRENNPATLNVLVYNERKSPEAKEPGRGGTSLHSSNMFSTVQSIANKVF